MKNKTWLFVFWLVQFIALPAAIASERKGLIVFWLFVAIILTGASIAALVRHHERQADARRLRPQARPPATIDRRKGVSQ